MTLLFFFRARQQTFTGDLQFTGAGSLTTPGVPAPAQAVPLTGSGGLTVQVAVAAPAAVPLTGTGTLSPVATALTATQPASLSGDGDLSAFGSIPGGGTGTVYSDNFDRAGPALGTNWISSTNPSTISNNQVVGSSGQNVARWVTAAPSYPIFSQMTYLGGAQVGPAVAIPAYASGSGVNSAAVGTYYMFRMGTGGTCNIRQKDAALTSTTQLSVDGPAWSAGDVARLEYDGTTLTGYINGTSVLSVDPASPITGQMGVGFFNHLATQSGVAYLDNWSGGTVGSTAFSGTVTFTGTGSLSRSGVPAPQVSTALTGSGSLGLTGAFTLGQQVPLAGTGSLTTAVNLNVPQPAALTGDGDLSAAGTITGTGITYSDNFNRANGGLGSNWISTTNPPTIASNQVVASAGNNINRWYQNAPSYPLFSQATFVGGNNVGPALALPNYSAGVVPAAPSIDTYYVLRSAPGSTFVTIMQKDSGVATYTALSGNSANMVAGDVYRLEYDGTTLTAFINGTQVLTATPGTPIAGQMGVGFAHLTNTQSGTALIDTWSGGSVGITAFSGTSTLSGSGSLTLSRTPAVSVNTALTGGGSLSFTGTPAPAQTVPLAGSGSLTATQTAVTAKAAPALTGTGTLTTTSTLTAIGSLALTGAGQLTTSSAPAFPVSVALSGSGTLSPVRVTRQASSAWAGTVTGIGWVNVANAVGVDDNTFATWTSSVANDVSSALNLSNFGTWASVPDDAVVEKLTIRIKGYSSHA